MPGHITMPRRIAMRGARVCVSRSVADAALLDSCFEDTGPTPEESRRLHTYRTLRQQGLR